MRFPTIISRFTAKRAKYIFVAVILVLIVWAGVAIDTKQFAAATSYQPEQFTELYFTDPNALPSAAFAGKTYVVPFAVVNHEGTTKTYKYEVMASDSVGVYKMTSGTVTLKPGERSVQFFNLIARGMTADPTVVTIHLLNQKPTIAFRTRL